MLKIDVLQPDEKKDNDFHFENEGHHTQGVGIEI
jgi:hypothetical protein